MIFPTLDQIATQIVLTIPADATVGDAMAQMLEHDLRDIVVEPDGDGGEYGIFTVGNLIRQHPRGVNLGRTLREVGYPTLNCAQGGENILEALPLLQDRNEYLGVVDSEGGLSGIVSYTDVVTSIDPKFLIERQQIGEIIHRLLVKSAQPDEPICSVLNQLTEVDDAVVITRQRRAVGIVTTRDAIRLLSAEIDPEAPVEGFMSQPVVTVGSDITIKDALDFVRARHFKRIVVADDAGFVIGVIPQKELVAIAYNRWAALLRSHAAELHEVVQLLEQRAARLEVLATTDSLTGLSNRSKLQHTLESEIHRCARYQTEPFSIVLFDLDHFKAINDTHGHLVGDEALRQLAEILGGHVREIDLAARWGGEEFMVMLPVTRCDAALRFAERMREMIHDEDFGLIGRLTVSAGVAEYHKGETSEQLFRRVDHALYEAKRGGRDRVQVADGDE